MTVSLAAPAIASSGRHVRVGDNFFAPKSLKISRGTRVTWTWVGGSGIAHNVTVTRGPRRFHSRTVSSGSYSHVFTSTGVYHLICTVHPSEMRETVTVR